MVVQRHECIREIVAAPHVELLWILTEFHFIVSMKFFMTINIHFLVMGAKNSPTNLCFRSLWSIMRYTMNLNLIMALICLSSKHDGVSS